VIGRIITAAVIGTKAIIGSGSRVITAITADGSRAIMFAVADMTAPTPTCISAIIGSGLQTAIGGKDIRFAERSDQ